MTEVLIYRDPRESLAKCSLTPLRGRPGIEFIDYDHTSRVDVGRRLLLHTDGPLLSPADAALGLDLLVVDCAWRRVPTLMRMIDGELVHRRLPELITAYPRVSRIFEDPSCGLASVEALYAALALLGAPRPELLEGYYWAEAFLAANVGRLPAVG